MLIIYTQTILAHSLGAMLLGILLIAVAAAGLTGWANFRLIRKFNHLPRTRASRKASAITAIELILLILCLGIWTLTPIRIFGLDTFALFLGACLSFLVVSPVITFFFFTNKQQNVVNMTGDKRNVRVALTLAITSAVLFSAVFFLLAVMVLGPLYVLFGG